MVYYCTALIVLGSYVVECHEFLKVLCDMVTLMLSHGLGIYIILWRDFLRRFLRWVVLGMVYGKKAPSVQISPKIGVLAPSAHRCEIQKIFTAGE